jgi:AraC family transcriptional regulator
MVEELKPGQFYGETRSIRIADAILSEVTHRHPRDIELHLHAMPFFLLLLDGSYSETSGSVTINYTPLTLGFHAAMMSHSDTIGPNGARMFTIELGKTWEEAIMYYGKMPAHVFELHGGEPSWLALRLYAELQKPVDVAHFTIESLLFELCAYLSRVESDDAREPEWLEPVVRDLQERFREKLALRELAKKAAVHPSHLAKAFHRFQGRPIGDYVTGLRVQFAARQIAAGESSLRLIAADAGFADQSHLTRVFKEFTGMPPAQYRRHMRFNERG